MLYLFVYFKFIYLSYNLSDDNNLSIILTRKILIIFLSICQCPLISIYHDKQKKINLSIILSMALNICHLNCLIYLIYLSYLSIYLSYLSILSIYIYLITLNMLIFDFVVFLRYFSKFWFQPFSTKIDAVTSILAQSAQAKLFCNLEINL